MLISQALEDEIYTIVIVLFASVVVVDFIISLYSSRDGDEVDSVIPESNCVLVYSGSLANVN